MRFPIPCGLNSQDDESRSVNETSTHRYCGIGVFAEKLGLYLRLFPTPLVTHGLVIFGAGNRYVYTLSDEDGLEQWRFETDWVVSGSLALSGKTLYFESDDGYLCALDALRGLEQWRFFL
jgi:outer membrane protein assembly factor BamB